jgi:glutamate dehydrogenase/leucine dehydrogenase
MKKSFASLYGLSQKHKCDLRTAAFVLGVGRVHEATRLRGL